MDNNVQNAAVIANIVQLAVSVTRKTAGNNTSTKIGDGNHFSKLLAEHAVSRLNHNLTKKLGA